MSMMVSFVLSFFPRDVLDEILNLIESVSEDFPSYYCCPIAWNAHKIKRVLRSTLAAEMLSLQEGLDASVYYTQMLEDILGIKS